jgi:hypothetical protein
MTGTKTGIATSLMIRVLQEAVDHGSLYHGLSVRKCTNRPSTIEDMIRRGLLRRKPHGYCEITDAGYAALRGDAS